MAGELSQTTEQENQMGLGTKVAEVIETSSAEFTAQCFKLDQAPPLGSLVKTKGELCEIYGIIYNVETHSLDPGRRVVARGEDMERKDDVFRANPQLAKLLSTDFKALVVGHRQGDGLHYYLPPTPAPIHGFVYVCHLEEVQTFAQSLDFLGLLVDARLPISVDEVIAACLRYVGQAHPDSQAFLVKAGREVARLLSGDSQRLNSVLKRLR